MKKKGSNAEFNAEREAALMTAFTILAAQRKYVQVADLCRQLVKMPSSRFWVSEERARDVIGSIERKGFAVIQGMRECKQRMFREIHHRFRTLRQRDPGRPAIDIIAEVIYSPAPEFYMEPANASYLIYAAKRRKPK